jgi:hypothetical protein
MLQYSACWAAILGLQHRGFNKQTANYLIDKHQQASDLRLKTEPFQPRIVTIVQPEVYEFNS